jgi:LysR family transcriptional activator of nhaA
MGSGMDRLNFNQLHLFWRIAHAGSITAAARSLRLSPSNLSSQLKSLESALGSPLFMRERRRLRLNEAGRIALDYADTMFTQAQELVDTLNGQPQLKGRSLLRIGALSSLSKNLQLEFCLPALRDASVKVIAEVGDLNQLQKRLQAHELDVVLSTMPVRTDEARGLHNHELARMPAYLLGRPPLRIPRGPWPKALEGVPLFLPGRQSRIRAGFDAWLQESRVRPLIKAEVDDMALLRLFALSGQGLALVPRIVVAPELKSGVLVKAGSVPGLEELFYAITATKRFPDARVEALIRRFRNKNK